MIFSNILEVYELTQTLLSSMEDMVEATEEGEVPLIGTCFEELTEVGTLDPISRRRARRHFRSRVKFTLYPHLRYNEIH